MSSQELLEYEANRLEGHGNDYQRLVAWMLLLKLAIEKRCFQLGFEMQCAKKFDDVVLRLENAWYLIQSKHCQPISEEKDTKLTKEMLFKMCDGEFFLPKYVRGFNETMNSKNVWIYGDVKQVIIMTNRDLDESSFKANEDYREVKPNDFLKFSQGRHIQLVNQEEELLESFKEEAFKRELKNIGKAMENLFENGKMSKILLIYSKYLKVLLTKHDQQVKLVESISNTDPDILKLYKDLSDKFSTKSVSINVMGNFWTNTDDLIKINIKRSTMTDFFSKLVIYVSQPNVDTLKKDLIDRSRHWMRSWIRPDDLGRLEECFIELPLNVVKKKFEEYEKPNLKRNHKGKLKNMKKFLQFGDGENMLKMITDKLENEIRKISKRSCASLQAIKQYYINRQICHCDNEYQITDEEFVRQISTDSFDKQQCIVLTTPPGMGKSTLLQYLAFEVQTLDSDKTVFLIYLNNFQENLPDINKIKDIVDSKIFQLDLSVENIDLIVNDDKTNIILFLDAFDELTEDNQNRFQILINILLKKSNIKIIISGRNHIRDKLINNHNAIPMTIKPFCKTDQVKFFEKFWEITSQNKEKFEEFSSKLLNKFNSDDISQEQDLIGVPLMTRMVAEIYSGPFQLYLNSDDDLNLYLPEERFTIDSLYEKFVTTCNVITMNKKYNVNNNIEPDRFFQPMLKAIDYDYQVFAVENILSTQLKTFVTDKRYHETLRSFEARVGNEQSLLVEKVANDPRFVHLSFGEYYAAKYLFELSGLKDKCVYWDQILDDLQKQESVRNFLLAMMNSHIVLDSVSTNICFNRLSKSNKNRLRLLKQLGKDIIFSSCKMDYSNVITLVHYLQEPFIFENIRDGDGKSVLEMAKASGARKVEMFLLDIFKQKIFCKNPLHFAVDSDRFELVKQLIALEEDVNSRDDDGNTTLFMAKSADICKYLIENDADFSVQNKIGETPLHVASKKGILQVVILLVENGAQVDVKSNDENTPLELAVKNFHLEIVRYYLNYTKIKINETIFSVNMPELLASLINDVEYEDDMDDPYWLWIKKCVDNVNVIKNVIGTCLFIGMGVNSQNKIGNTALHIAAKYNCIEGAKMLINKNAKANIQNNSGLTPLHVSILSSSNDILNLLISQEIDFSIANTYGDTAVHFAARSHTCLPLMIEKLKLSPSSLDMLNYTGQTALNYAIQYEREENIRLLLDAGARVDTALSFKYAADYLINSTENFKFLLKQVNKITEDMGALLLNAAYLGCQESVQVLLDANVNINSKNRCKETALHYAAKHGHYDVVKLLVEGKADINCIEVVGQTPLHKAVEQNHFEVVKLLLENKATVNVPDNSGLTPLHTAAINNNLSVIKLLIEYKATLDCQDDDGKTPLHLCSKIEIFDHLVLAGADHNLKDNKNNTVLHIAAMQKTGELIKHLIEKCLLKTDCVDKNGSTALHLASVRGYEKNVQLLIDHNAKVSVLDNQGETPLFKAIIGCHLEVVRCLLNNSSKHDLLSYKHLLHETITSDRKIIELLLDAGFDMNAIDDSGRTPLHVAAKSHNSVNFKVFIENGADVDALDDDGNSPLHHAVKCWTAFRKVSYLIDYSSNTNVKNKNGETPLHQSIVSYFDPRITKILIAKNACIHVADKHGNTPLHLAIIHGRCELALHLAGLEPEFDRQNKNGETALHLAVLKNDFPIVRCLVEKGTDLQLKTVEGKTAFNMVQENKFQEIYEYLKSKMIGSYDN